MHVEPPCEQGVASTDRTWGGPSGEGAARLIQALSPAMMHGTESCRSGTVAVLRCPSHGMLAESLWDLDHRRRLSSRLSWDRSLTFARDRSSPIHAGMDLGGR